MIVLMRAITYSALFIGFALVFVPARVLSLWGVTRPTGIGVPQLAGMAVGAIGAVLAASCILSFALVGKGTPAPFDPPRRLVTRGPYRLLRNPMYMGAGLALTGAALYYQSVSLLGYTGLFLLLAHLLVVHYEEPVLRRTFGVQYEAYCRQAHRWWPTF